MFFNSSLRQLPAFGSTSNEEALIAGQLLNANKLPKSTVFRIPLLSLSFHCAPITFHDAGALKYLETLLLPWLAPTPLETL